MEYPNNDYILSYGSKKNDDGKLMKGLFIAKQQDIHDGELKGLVIVPDTNPDILLNGHNLLVREKYIKDLKNDKIYSWNDMHIAIREEDIYLAVNESLKILWKLPNFLFNYLEIRYCYIYSILVISDKLCIQKIKYRTTINNINRGIWSKNIIIPRDKDKLLKSYSNSGNIKLNIPDQLCDHTLESNEYKAGIKNVYFTNNKNRFYLKDIQIVKQDKFLLLVSYKMNKTGNLLGYIEIDDEEL